MSTWVCGIGRASTTRAKRLAATSTFFSHRYSVPRR
jgi:hypothetical protein